ncbi:MAG TPA: adenylate/guanylate cyclase domain-containing protein [Leptospiraceae bacterium]|nr:adenylate/guanylate cyclase domain-containing protein [Leptospiraceae bacterium]
MKIKYKFFLAFLLLNIALSALFGISMYFVAYQLFFKQFRDSKTALVKNIAFSIDGDQHRNLRDESASGKPEYRKLVSYLESVFSEETFIRFLYTFNYEERTDSFYYVGTGFRLSRDTVWIEADHFAFSIYAKEDGSISVSYDDNVYESGSFITDDGIKKYKFNIKKKDNKEYIFLEDAEFAEILNSSPLSVRFFAKSAVNEKENSIKGDFSLHQDKMSYSIWFTKKGDLDLTPGQPLINSNLNSIKEQMKTGKVFTSESFLRDAYGSFLVIRAPIKDRTGKTVGFTEANISEKQVIHFQESVRGVAFFVFIIVFIVSLAVSMMLSVYFTKPIQILTESTVQLAKGDLNYRISMRSKDELGRLADSFNSMASSIESSANMILQTNIAYRRFVPEEFLHFLNKDNIIDVGLGEYIQKKMTVLFCDIRDFTSLSEKMTPKENFLFLNAFLERMEPIIKKNYGFIDKYIGDAIMALFSESPDDALDAAVEMIQTLGRFNEERSEKGLPAIRIGIGLNFGELMLGTIGGESRMDSTVIGDTVNLTSRLEAVTKDFHVPLIVSETLVKNLKSSERYCLREIGSVKVKGKEENVTVYECFSHEPADTIQRKKQSLDFFNFGIQHYKQKAYSEAAKMFSKCQTLCPEDPVPVIYLYRCRTLMQNRAEQNFFDLKEEVWYPKKILVADDNKAVLDLLTGFLRKNNFQTIKAESVSEAVDKFNLYRPEYLITDFYFSNGINGDRLISHIRSRSNETGSRVKIAVVSAEDPGALKEKLKDFNADLVLSKPFQWEDILGFLK